MARRKLTWESAQWSSTPAVPWLAGGINPGQLAAITLLTDAVVEATEDEQIWVERCVGQFFCWSVSSAGAAGDNGVAKVRVTKARSGNGVLAFSNPWDIAEANDSFLTDKVVPVFGAANGFDGSLEFFNAFAHPAWSSLDVRVGRSIRVRESLVLVYAPSSSWPVADDRIFIGGWLRLLVAR